MTVGFIPSCLEEIVQAGMTKTGSCLNIASRRQLSSNQKIPAEPWTPSLIPLLHHPYELSPITMYGHIAHSTPTTNHNHFLFPSCYLIIHLTLSNSELLQNCQFSPPTPFFTASSNQETSVFRLISDLLFNYLYSLLFNYMLILLCCILI